MRRAAALLIVVSTALLLRGCVYTSGPDCTHACDFVQGCATLNKTFFLSCSTLGLGCYDNAADCADCIDNNQSCDALAQGVCDSRCLVGGVPADAGSTDAGGADAGFEDAGGADAT